MKFYFLFSSIILFNHLFNITCFEDDDLDIVVSVNDGKSRIEAFQSKKNEILLKNITSNNTYNIMKLKWHSLGYPVIIKDTKTNKSNNERFYNIRKDGFSVLVQLLTEYQKKLIIQSIYEKYNINIELHQIEQIPLSSFKCDLYLNYDDSDSVVKGTVKGLVTNDQLRVDFKANEEELVFLENISSENDNDLKLECTCKSINSEIEKRFTVKTDQSNLVKIKFYNKN